MEKDSADNVRHELDNQFAALRELIYAPDPQTSIDDTAKPLTVGMDDKEPPEKLAAETDSFTAKLLPAVDYDHHVRELAFDKRAKPKDRTKTDEELALEAKEALEGAEKKRRRRMLGLPESDSEDEARKGKRRRRGPDDLDDDFDQDLGEYEGLGVGLERGTLREEGDGDSDLELSEEASGVGSQDESLDDEDEEGDGDDEVEGKIVELVPSSQAAREKSKGKLKEELPFTFPCPESHGEFLEIVEGLEHADVCIVVQRLRTLYHASLAPDNKFKLQVCKKSFSSLSLLLKNPSKETGNSSDRSHSICNITRNVWIFPGLFPLPSYSCPYTDIPHPSRTVFQRKINIYA